MAVSISHDGLTPDEPKKTERPIELYLVWQDGEDEQFYNQYFSLRDAVASEEDAEIFKANLEPMGQYRLVTKLIRKPKKEKK